jgi:hypothetical protein
VLVQNFVNDSDFLTRYLSAAYGDTFLICQYVNQVELAQDVVKWRAVVMMAINLNSKITEFLN